MPEPTHRLYRGETIEVRRAAQRERLVIAARDVFASRGFHAASIEEIVATARVSRTSFYRCFDSKGDALLAVLETGAQRLVDVLGAVAASEAGPETKIRVGVHVLVRALAADPGMAKVMLIEAAGATPEVDRARIAVRRRFAALLKGQMEQFPGWQARPPAEVSMVALATIAAIVETLSHLVATGGLDDWREPTKYLSDYTLRALAPPEH
jgi:AcrR family transcriptional regulator